MLHDLQGLGSLTTIWLPFSDAWDRTTKHELGPQKAVKNRKPHQSGVPGARLVALRPSRAQ
jgi:hypothetical protein